jgi:hypothetical protein
MPVIRSLFPIIILITFFFCSCGKEEPYSGNDITLRFSADTLRFDTVFTTLGSATRSIKVYNDRAISVIIPEFSLSDGGNTFRMNVDGESGTSIQNILIPAKDSIYVFIEATIDPDNPLSVSPYIIEESILIKTGSETVNLYLEAWGQNANYLPFRKAGGRISLLTCDFGEYILDDPKPYVIYGVLAVDSCELVIPEGTQIYVHGGLVKDDELLYNDGLLLFLENGKINSKGTPDNNVVFQGDRLESEFSDIEGQWSGIRFLPGSKGNKISYTTIKNSIIGSRVDSTAELTIESSKIFNTSSSGIIGYFGDIKIRNSLIYNNAGYSIQMVNGGTYEILHTTIANYYNQNEGLIATNYICTDPLCNEFIIAAPLNLKMTNCIVDGNADVEIIIDDLFDGSEPSFFTVELNNNTIKHNNVTSNVYLSQCISCQYHLLTDPLFTDLNLENFRLDSLSVALDKGVFLNSISIDIEGNLRNTNTPDLGCYERNN